MAHEHLKQITNMQQDKRTIMW